jgi:hypothetical protein
MIASSGKYSCPPFDEQGHLKKRALVMKRENN